MKCQLLCAVVLALAVPAQGQLLINEIYTDAQDALEIYNAGSSLVSLTGYRVEFGGLNQSLVWTPGTYFFPAGTAIGPGQIISLREATTGPAVAPGTTIYTVTTNINWATTGSGQARGGACILLDGTGQPVDMVRWLGAVPPNQFGATFIGTYNPNATSFGRVDFTDDDNAADWGDESLNLGLLSSAQLALFDVLDLSITTTGAGDLSWIVTTGNPSVPGGQIYNLVSLQDITPDGSGPFFGIGFDAVLLLGQPASAANPFHTFLDATGQWSLSIPFGLPPGLHVESVTLLLGAAGVDRISNVATVTF